MVFARDGCILSKTKSVELLNFVPRALDIIFLSFSLLNLQGTGAFCRKENVSIYLRLFLMRSTYFSFIFLMNIARDGSILLKSNCVELPLFVPHAFAIIYAVIISIIKVLSEVV